MTRTDELKARIKSVMVNLPNRAALDQLCTLYDAEIVRLTRDLLAEREWRPIETAKKDGKPILIKLKTVLPQCSEAFAGIQFVASHPGVFTGGFDVGWHFAAPVGMGGFPDEWIAGWLPLPPPNPNPAESDSASVTVRENDK